MMRHSVIKIALAGAGLLHAICTKSA